MGHVPVLLEAPELLCAGNSAPSAANETAERRRRCSSVAPDPLCSISERIQVRQATGVTGASGNDYQMGVIGFQAEGTLWSLDASEDSSQQLHSHVWAKRRSVFLHPDESVRHSQISFIVWSVHFSPSRCLPLVVHLCLNMLVFHHISGSMLAI